MNTAFDKTAKQALGLGLISGTRATLATTIAAHYLSRQTNKSLEKSRLGFIQRGATSVVTKVITAAEMAGDKLPNIPDRTIPPALFARVASGALSGAIVATANEEKVTRGIIIGGIAALASTYLLFFLRKKISDSGYLKEPWPGVVEDALAIGSGVLLMR
ncbi:MAG TPA: DUF4126 family protein [Niastella sp.]|nr:DUF4126 family protein [Niastella sp.]